MSEYARAALRLLTPFRNGNDQKKQSHEPTAPPPQLKHVQSDHKMAHPNKSFRPGAQNIMGGRQPLFRIHDNGSSSQGGETNMMSQLTMSQLSSSNDSNSNTTRNQRTSFPMPASLQSQNRKSNTTLPRNGNTDAFQKVASSNHGQEMNDSSRYIADPRRVHLNPNYNIMTSDSQTPTLYQLLQQDAFARMDGSLYEGAHVAPTTAFMNASVSLSQPLHNTGFVYDRPISRQNSLSQPSKKRSWMEACLDTLRTPYRKKNNPPCSSHSSKPELKTATTLSSVDAALIMTPSLTVATLDSSVEVKTLAIKDATATHSDHGFNVLVVEDFQRRHADAMIELQQTQQQYCKDLQARYDDLVNSMQKEAIHDKNAIEQYQTQCTALSDSLQKELTEFIKVNEDRMNSLVASRVRTEIEKWSSSLESEPWIRNMMEERLSQALATHDAKTDEKFQMLEKRLLALAQLLQRPNADAPSVLDNSNDQGITTTNTSITQKAHTVTHLENSEPLLEDPMRKRRKLSVAPATAIRSTRVKNQDQKIPSVPLTIRAKSPFYTPSHSKAVSKPSNSNAASKLECKRSEFDASPHKWASRHTTEELVKGPKTEKGKLITPMLSQDAIRKRPVDAKRSRSLNLDSVPPFKLGLASKAIAALDKVPVKSNIIPYLPSTMPKRRRNKDKVQEKKENSFHHDPFDFL